MLAKNSVIQQQIRVEAAIRDRVLVLFLILAHCSIGRNEHGDLFFILYLLELPDEEDVRICIVVSPLELAFPELELELELELLELEPELTALLVSTSDFVQ